MRTPFKDAIIGLAQLIARKTIKTHRRFHETRFFINSEALAMIVRTDQRYF